MIIDLSTPCFDFNTFLYYTKIGFCSFDIACLSKERRIFGYCQHISSVKFYRMKYFISINCGIFLNYFNNDTCVIFLLLRWR